MSRQSEIVVSGRPRAQSQGRHGVHAAGRAGRHHRAVGSGKSSLAFDTIYAEGQRRYVESLSAYARQFLGQMDKPDVDSIEGLSPAISIDQKTTSRNPRSTVGTVTEIYDYLRLLWARIGKPHCYNCGRPIAAQSAEQIIDQLMGFEEGTRFMVLAPIVRGRKGEFREQLEHLRSEGFTRVKVDGELKLLEEEIVLDKKFKHDLSVVVDRLIMRAEVRKRLADSVETAVALADGMLDDRARATAGEVKTFSERFACLHCGISMPELEPRSFSFNSPHGACPRCTASARRWRSTRTSWCRTRRCRSARARSCRGRPARRPTTTSSRRHRRPLRDRPRRAVGGPADGDAGPVPATARRATRSTSPTGTGWAAGGRT